MINMMRKIPGPFAPADATMLFCPFHFFSYSCKAALSPLENTLHIFHDSSAVEGGGQAPHCKTKKGILIYGQHGATRLSIGHSAFSGSNIIAAEVALTLLNAHESHPPTSL